MDAARLGDRFAIVFDFLTETLAQTQQQAWVVGNRVQAAHHQHAVRGAHRRLDLVNAIEQGIE